LRRKIPHKNNRKKEEQEYYFAVFTHYEASCICGITNITAKRLQPTEENVKQNQNMLFFILKLT